MRKAASMFFVYCVCLSVVFITTTACQGAVTTFTFNENGNGSADGTQLTWGMGAPTVGPATLYYVLTGVSPFVGVGTVTGDVGIWEPGSTSELSDVLRFDNVGGQARVYVYSDMDELPYDLADVGIPSLWYMSGGANNDPVYVNEIGPEGNNYADYTPANQTSDPTVTYHFISDIPEPATLALLSLGGLALLRRKK